MNKSWTLNNLHEKDIKNLFHKNNLYDMNMELYLFDMNHLHDMTWYDKSSEQLYDINNLNDMNKLYDLNHLYESNNLHDMNVEQFVRREQF